MAQTTNFRVFDANSTNTLTSDQFKSNAKVSGGFASGDTLPSNLLNTTLRQTSLICTALMEAFCGSNTTLNVLSNLDDVVSALQAGISSGGGGAGYVTTEAFNTYTSQTNTRLTTDEANIAANATEITKIKNGTTTLNVTAARAIQADSASTAEWADTASSADNAGWANLAAVSRGTVGAYTSSVATMNSATFAEDSINVTIPTTHNYIRVLLSIGNIGYAGREIIPFVFPANTYAYGNDNAITVQRLYGTQSTPQDMNVAITVVNRGTSIYAKSNNASIGVRIIRVDSSVYPL